MEGFTNGGQVPAYGNEKTSCQVIAGLREENQRLREEIKDLHRQNRVLLKRGNDFGEEVVELRDWKAQAMEVMPNFQAIGVALGVPLGRGVSEQILPGIAILKTQNRDLLLQLRRLQSYCCHYVRGYHQTARYREVEEALSKHDHSLTHES